MNQFNSLNLNIPTETNLFSEYKKRLVVKIMGRFDMFPIFIVTFVSKRVTLIATHSKAQKQILSFPSNLL